jgi:hypothetical protein
MPNVNRNSLPAISDSQQLAEFSFSETKKMHSIIINNQPWFAAKDVCNILELSNPTESLKSLEEDEKLTSEILRSGQKRKLNFVNESGLYNLIFRSNKPEARVFRRWVTGVVLPQIRQSGQYQATNSHSVMLPDSEKERFKKSVRSAQINGQELYLLSDVMKYMGIDVNYRPLRNKMRITRRMFPQWVWLAGRTWMVNEDFIRFVLAASMHNRHQEASLKKLDFLFTQTKGGQP